MPRKKRHNSEIEKDLEIISKGLLSALSKGEIERIVKFSVPLRSLIAEFQQEEDEKNIINFAKVVKNPVTASQISKVFKMFLSYLGNLSKIDISEIPLDDEQIGLLTLETNLPLRWTTQEDFLFIDRSYKHKAKLIQELKKIGQQHLFEYNGNELKDLYSFKKLKVSELRDLLRSQKKTVGSEIQVIRGSDNQIKDAFVDDVTKALQNFNTGRNTVIKFEELWNGNQMQGFQSRIGGEDHRALRSQLENQDILVISPGPSLKFCIDDLKNVLKEKFVTIAVAQSMPALNKYEIRPDFIMVSDPTDFSKVLDDTLDIKKISFIGDESVHPNFLRKDFKKIYTIVSSRDIFGLSVAFNCQELHLFGGTVSLRACDLALKSGAKSITVIGQDLAFKKENYFFNQEHLKTIEILDQKGKKIFKRGDNEKYSAQPIPVLDWNDEYIYTKPDYYLYLKEFEQFAGENDKSKLFNCSEGGVKINGFTHQKFNVRCANIKKRKHRTLEKIEKNDYLKKASSSQAFLKKNVGIINKFIFETNLLLTEFQRNDIAKINLQKIDKIENKLINLSRNNSKIGLFFASQQIELTEATKYVTVLEENIRISYNFYHKMYKQLVKLRKSCITLKKNLDIK